MLRFLTLLFVCAISFLAPLENSKEYGENQPPVQQLAQGRVASNSMVTEQLPAADCSSQEVCCTLICSTCQVSLSARWSDFLVSPVEAPAVPDPKDNFLRSVFLGGDPPVPRLQSA